MYFMYMYIDVYYIYIQRRAVRKKETDSLSWSVVIGQGEMVSNERRGDSD